MFFYDSDGSTVDLPGKARWKARCCLRAAVKLQGSWELTVGVVDIRLEVPLEGKAKGERAYRIEMARDSAETSNFWLIFT